jgi:Domain of unknown function (DUF4129)
VVRLIVAGSGPVEVGRDDAREAARRELARPMYHEDDPSLLERGISWLLERFDQLLDRIVATSPGGWAGLVGLLLIGVLAVVAVRLRLGPTRRSSRRGHPLQATISRSAHDHRRAADAAAAAGDWAEAVRERLRAVVRGLEERGLLEDRPGRTADEAAAEAARVLPERADDLAAAARDFDDVWYGGQRADAAMDRRLRTLDEALRAAPPQPVASTVP